MRGHTGSGVLKRRDNRETRRGREVGVVWDKRGVGTLRGVGILWVREIWEW